MVTNVVYGICLRYLHLIISQKLFFTTAHNLPLILKYCSLHLISWTPQIQHMEEGRGGGKRPHCSEKKDWWPHSPQGEKGIMMMTSYTVSLKPFIKALISLNVHISLLLSKDKQRNIIFPVAIHRFFKKMLLKELKYM